MPEDGKIKKEDYIYICPHATLEEVGVDTVLSCPYKERHICKGTDKVIASCPEDVRRNDMKESLCYILGLY